MPLARRSWALLLSQPGLVIARRCGRPSTSGSTPSWIRPPSESLARRILEAYGGRLGGSFSPSGAW